MTNEQKAMLIFSLEILALALHVALIYISGNLRSTVRS